MTSGSGAGTAWIAALEQLPPDSRGFRRTLRLHAVAAQDSGPAPRAACGYSWRPHELRPERTWASVTATGRCALCDLQLRRARSSGVELTESVDLSGADGGAGRPRLVVVAEEPDGDDAGGRPPERP